MSRMKFRGDKLNPTLSLITFNVNALNFPIEVEIIKIDF